MLMQAAAFSFTKIDNSFAFFDLRGAGLPPPAGGSDKMIACISVGPLHEAPGLI
jgi:hypothetical protein